MYQNEKVDMRVKYTREWTFEALYRLLEVKKYEDIKISEIIKKAGISRATFYRNFSTKDDIVKIKVRAFFKDFINSVFEHYAAGYSGDEIYLIQFFFKRIDEEEKLVDTVIKTKLEYLMVNGILELINIRREQFYSIVKKAHTLSSMLVNLTQPIIQDLLFVSRIFTFTLLRRQI